MSCSCSQDDTCGMCGWCEHGWISVSLEGRRLPMSSLRCTSCLYREHRAAAVVTPDDGVALKYYETDRRTDSRAAARRLGKTTAEVTLGGASSGG